MPPPLHGGSRIEAKQTLPCEQGEGKSRLVPRRRRPGLSPARLDGGVRVLPAATARAALPRGSQSSPCLAARADRRRDDQRTALAIHGPAAAVRRDAVPALPRWRVDLRAGAPAFGYGCRRWSVYLRKPMRKRDQTRNQAPSRYAPLPPELARINPGC